ncbi:MAG: type II toxin-antitoxin system RelE/ParE family toxin [candidate division Zixibacteria bacterium]|nr:type II toxin-antitoxin system RelE/ParE family toxin [candidate division Zixibacteria bacterium]
MAKFTHLAEFGHALRRPDRDNLGDGIWKLRVKSESVNVRVLYVFHHREIVVLPHGINKQQAEVPRKEIATAKQRMKEYLASPSAHTVEEYLW